MVADRTEGFCPGAVTREPGDKQQSPATGRLLEGWRVRGASEEVAFESQPGLGQLLGVRRLACRWEQAGVVATAPRDGPSKCFRRGAWRALAAASWPWRVRCCPVRPGSALLWWHRNRCPPRWRCQHGGVCRQPGVGRGFICFPGEEVSSPSVGVFKEGRTFLLGWKARPGHVVSALATNPSSLPSRGGFGHPHHGPWPPASVPGGPPRGGGPGGSSASGGGPGGRRSPGGRPGAASGEAGVRGASGEENGPGGRRAAAAHAASATAELPGHDGPAAHEHPYQQPRY